ncbi:hypothetical protein [Acetobacter sp.]|uniref:hypothetical protein n=1 Tax=Acetobacter sp. TaxID=440 RepID=UPI0025880C51|nr:hypothetical protein [Acetobacter sp.]MCC6104698.1 hypothetical protein [Acetobacter sp.]
MKQFAGYIPKTSAEMSGGKEQTLQGIFCVPVVAGLLWRDGVRAADPDKMRARYRQRNRQTDGKRT